VGDDVRQVKLSLGPANEGVGGYPLTLELIGGSQRESDTLPRAQIEGSRPTDDRGVVLDREGIHALLVRSQSPSPGVLQRVGDYLGGLLGYGAVGAKWTDLRTRFPGESTPGSEGLSVLLDIAAPDLRVLPWELARIGSRWVFTDPENPYARITPRFDPDPPPEPDWWPLRVTVIVGAEADDPVVKVEQELENLYSALDKVGPEVEYDVIKQPRRGDFLLDELDRLRPHVLHFIGHGESNGGTGVLVMNDQEGRWDWTADQIIDTMPIAPRIAALNACRSGDHEPQVGTWQVADAFIQRGAYAVLAMQGDIDGSAAATFSRGLYDALLENATLDVAVARGRRRTLAAGSSRRDFGLPTLTLSRPPNRVLPLRLGIDQDRLKIVDMLLPRRPFVDRKDHRRTLLERLDPPAADGVALTSIEGESDVGKTALARWTLRQLACRGHEVVYVDLAVGYGTRDGAKCSAIDVLRAIREAVHKVRITEPGAARPFDAWTFALNHLCAGKPVPAGEVAAPVHDDDAQFDSDPHDLEEIFRRFRDVLTSLAGAKLLIALDHTEAVDPEEFRDDVFPKLIEPIVLDQNARVGLLLAGLGVGDLLVGITPGYGVVLRPFEACEMPALMRQYLRYHDAWSSAQAKIWTPLLERWDGPSMPGRFEEFRQFMGNFK
jgi:CHAT domain